MPTLTPRDLFRPEVLTPMIEREVDEPTAWDLDFCPINTTRRTKVKINVRVGTMSRLGQFRADNGMTPISVARFKAESMEISMPLLSEKEIIMEDVLRQLNSVDTDIAQDAVNEILDQGNRLRRQNTNLTRWMVFRALQDILTITYPDGGSIDIDYGLENADTKMSATHLVTAGVLWSNIAADIIGDTLAWSKLISDDAGAPASDLTMLIGTDGWRDIQKNTGIQAQVGTSADPVRPTREDQVAEVLGIGEIRVYDAQYKDQSDVTQRYLPANKAILLAPSANGFQTVQVLDGPVVRYNPSTGRLQVGNNPGAVTEIWASPDPPSENVRVTTARFPLVMREGVVSATIR